MKHTDMIGESSNSLRLSSLRTNKVWPEFWDRFSTLQHATKIEKLDSCFKITATRDISHSIDVLFGGHCVSYFGQSDVGRSYWFRGVQVIIEITDAT